MSSVSDIAFGPYLRAAIAALIASSRDITRLAGPLLLPEGGAPLIDREPPLPSTRRGVASSCVSTGACSSSADGFTLTALSKAAHTRSFAGRGLLPIIDFRLFA